MTGITLSDSRMRDGLIVVLVSTRNPLNIGAVARAMQNFDFHHLRVVHPYDPAFREARSAVGAAELLASAEEYESVAVAVADCTLVAGTTAPGHRRAEQHEVRSLKDAAPMILREVHAENGVGRVALLFGSEKTGLSNDDLSHCDWRLEIPTGKEQPSLNLGQAVAICLYELKRGMETISTPDPTEQATSANLERAAQVWLDSLEASGYFATESNPERMAGVRRFVHRLHLSEEDATLLLGMLRQTLWKLRHRDP